MLERELRKGRTRSTARRASVLIAGAFAALCASMLVMASASASAAPFPFEPIRIQRINLPSNITEASDPVFARDGRHLLFWSERDLWITTLGGGEVHCLSCGLANDPRPEKTEQEGLTTPFPDGKRIFFGGYGNMAVLECKPTIVNCTKASVLPVDFTTSVPKYIPPGGAVSTWSVDVGGAASPKLSQDGVHVAFSDVRSDSIENMMIGTLKRTKENYTVTNPKVINPAGPASASDTSLAGWSESSALYEFKTFTDGGADATYVEVGGPGLNNPDVWSINLATGQRTRLTSNPDWDEDNAVSPDGELLALWSNRTEHYVDWSSLLPVRDFIDAPAIALGAHALVFSPKRRECAGPMWLMPSSGDAGASLAGEPIVDYEEPKVHVTNNITGWPQWSPSGTMLALNTQSEETALSAPYLLVAHLTARKPVAPLPAVSSEPGTWAPAPYEYHGAMGFDGVITLHGAGGGTVTVGYGGLLGGLEGEWSETYENYSENGTDFVSGTVTIQSNRYFSGKVVSHLTMTGVDTGSNNGEGVYNEGTFVSGHTETTYDGTTVTGPAPEVGKEGCPSKLPKEPALHVTATSLGGGTYEVKVTASVAEVGANETATDVEPVNDALVTVGVKKTHTNDEGVATVTVGKNHELHVSAGDTLAPTSTYLE